MTIAQFKDGWTVNFALEDHQIDADLTPPERLEDLIEAPSETMRTSSPIGFETKEAAIEELNLMLQYSLKSLNHMKLFCHKPEPGREKLDEYLKRKTRYLEAVERLLKMHEQALAS